MPTTVLATKLHAPLGRRVVVTRGRLTRRLDAVLEPGRRLGLVSAPAGFGKTSLVGDWFAHCGRRRPAPRMAWLSLDAGDDDPPRLLTHLLAAVRGIDEDIDSDTVDLPDIASVPVEAVTTRLINDLARMKGPIVLVLDDYHVLEAKRVHEAMGFLLDHLPPHVHLVITSRADPPLPLARLRARDELVEVRAADLRFTPDEATSFLNHVMGLDLAAADVAVLETRTEGWVAGLQLAALSLRGRTDVSGFLGDFTGSDRFVLDYLVEEVLERQPPEVRDFLLHTCILDRLTGPLCDAVTGRADGNAMLERLERANLFVVALDAERSWLRYHHLFADVLRNRLLGHDPDLVPVLHQRASGWFEQHDLVEDAVRHALAGGDFVRAGHLMELGLPVLRRNRQDATVLGWLDSLPDTVVRASAVLSVFYGWKLLVSGDLDAVEVRLDDAESALAAGMTSDVGNEELRTLPATLAMYRASVAQARGDATGTAHHARRALDLAGPGDHFSRGSAAGFLGLAAWAAGDLAEALETFAEAVRSLRLAGNVADAKSSTVVLADMWLVAGRPDRARALLEAAVDEAADHESARGVVAPFATTGLHVGLAELDYELGDLPGAARHLETAQTNERTGATDETRHRWFVAMARVQDAAGEWQQAIDLLDRAMGVYRRGFLPDVRPIAAMRARILIKRGRLMEAADWARERGVSTADNLSYLREFDHLTLVRLLLAQHRDQDGPVADGGAGALLERLYEAAEGSARAGSTMEILMLQALAHEAQGRREPALQALGRALTEAPGADGYVRLFLDEGAPMLSLLGACEKRAGAGRDRARHLLQVGAGRGPSAVPPQGASAAPAQLSRRELQVLRLLDSSLTGPEIARELFVSQNTLRSHTKHIFTKLGVNSRIAAVGRGHERGLL